MSRLLRDEELATMCGAWHRDTSETVCNLPAGHGRSERFLPGDRVRHRDAGLGTVIPNTDPSLQHAAVTPVNMDRVDIPDGLFFRTAELRLSGTRCLPFEEMTMKQRHDHLRIAHGYNDAWLRDAGLIATGYGTTHDFAHAHNNPPIRVPHTHRKEPRT